MLTMRMIGDCHGFFKRYRKVIRNVEHSLQLGDMGVGFKKADYTRDENYRTVANPPFYAMQQGEHRFIRGNHDNPEACKRQRFYIPDGTTHHGIFCMGGAVSVDRQYRTEGLDWWADEECSEEELEQHIETYIKLKPDIVATHECPESIAGEILAAFRMDKIGDPSRTRIALERMFYHHEPRLWFFGHWHTSIQFTRGKTRFRCLNELEYEDIPVD